MRYLSIAESRAGKKAVPKKPAKKSTPKSSADPAASKTTNGGESAPTEENA